MRLLTVVAAATLLAAPGWLPAHPASTAAPASKRIAVVVIQNGDTPGEQQDLADTGYVRDVFFGSSQSLASWMTTASQGRLTFAPAGQGVFTTPPSDDLRDAGKNGCHTSLATRTAEDHLNGKGVTYDSLAIIYDTASCGWGGLGMQPGRHTWYPPRPHIAAIVHEIGHNFGFPHQNKRDCPGGSISSCGDPHCCNANTPMSGGGENRGYSSLEVVHLGWIDPAAKSVATGPGTFTLRPLYATGPGPKVVEYRASSSLSYFIETRAPASGVDSAISNPGVRVYSITDGVLRNVALIDPGQGYVPAGSAVTDTASGVKFSVRSSSPTGAVISIEKPGTATVNPSRTVPVLPSASASPSASPQLPSSPDTTQSPSPVTQSGIVDNAATPSSDNSMLKIAIITAGIASCTAIAVLIYRIIRKPRSRHRRSAS